MDLADGYYWVRMKSGGLTIGYLDKAYCVYNPWTVVGSDEIIPEDEIQVIRKVDNNIQDVDEIA